MSMRTKYLPSVALAILTLAAAGPLRAQNASTCTTAADCPQGTTCEVVGGTACSTPACAPGETCPAPTPCVSQDVKGCVPGPCTTDADCASDMVCYASTVKECSGQASAGCVGDNCPAPTPATETCTEQTTRRCTARYLLPCQQDADCGAHFTCVQDSEMCACAGSSGSGGGSSSGSSGGGARDPGANPSGGGSAGPVDAGGGLPIDIGAAPSFDAGCTCTRPDTRHCEAETISCKTNAECPTNWQCVQEVSAKTVTCAVAPGYDAGACAEQPSTTTAASSCRPPYGRLYSADHSVGASPQNTAGGTTNTTGEKSTAPSAGDAGTAKSSGSSKSGWCSVSSPGTDRGEDHGAWLLLALLGLALGRRRQR